MTTALLVALSTIMLVVYFFARPGWFKTGPSLLDAFVISVLLYACGAVAVAWDTTLAHIDIVVTMALVALISSLVGAVLVSIVMAPALVGMNFKRLHAASAKSSDERVLIVGIAVLSAVVCVVFVYLLFTSPVLSTFLSIENIVKYSTLGFARNAVTSGSAGYMAPGFIKQFRDTLLPLTLYAMILLYERPFRKWSFWLLLAVTFSAMLVNGQRSSMVFFLLGLGMCAYYVSRIRRLDRPPARLSMGRLVLAGAGVLLVWTLLSVALGRTGKEDSSVLAVPVNAVAALFDRAAATLPRENADSYPIWGVMGPTDGRFWLESFSSILKTNEPQNVGLATLSNQLSSYLGGSGLGNSPLGLPPDIWMTWGWTGLFVVPLLYAFFFGLLEMLLLSESSALYFAIKIYLFIALPLCVSPYTFILSGGAICLMLVVGIKCVEPVRAYLPQKLARAP